MSTPSAAYRHSARSREGTLLQKPLKQFGIGRRWVGCGWRLFLRNPWQLAGIGLVCATLIIVLDSIPLFGAALIALLGPFLLASGYLTVDAVSMQKTAMPPVSRISARLGALMRSPKDLLVVFDNEERVMLVFAASIYSLVGVVLLNILAHLIIGGPYSAGSSLSLGIGTLLGNLTSMLLILALHLVLAASIVYALPLAVLHNEPLIPAIMSSLRMSLRHVFALVVVLSLLLGFYLLGALGALWSVWAKYIVWLVGGPVLFPLTVTSAYCSYRTVYPQGKPPAA